MLIRLLFIFTIKIINHAFPRSGMLKTINIVYSTFNRNENKKSKTLNETHSIPPGNQRNKEKTWVIGYRFAVH